MEIYHQTYINKKTMSLKIWEVIQGHKEWIIYLADDCFRQWWFWEYLIDTYLDKYLDCGYTTIEGILKI